MLHRFERYVQIIRQYKYYDNLWYTRMRVLLYNFRRNHDKRENALVQKSFSQRFEPKIYNRNFLSCFFLRSFFRKRPFRISSMKKLISDIISLKALDSIFHFLIKDIFTLAFIRFDRFAWLDFKELNNRTEQIEFREKTKGWALRAP